MPKISIVGGSSEIGNAISDQLMSHFPGKYETVLRLTTSLKSTHSIHWNPSSIQGVKEGLEKIDFEPGDLVIVALGSLGKAEKLDHILDFDHIAEIYSINQLVPILTLSHVCRELEKVGGGTIILLSSTAAFPVLKSNFLYGSAKQSLDYYARQLQRSGFLQNTQINIVRSGFVQTKLNIGRTPTPFARTSEEVAEIVVSNLQKEIIWTPVIFKFISFVLHRIPLAKRVADILVEKSKQ